MKKWISKSNLITFVILAFALYMQGPTILKNFQTEGTKLATEEYNQISADGLKGKVLFPPQNLSSMTIFWATWCAPCKLEMQRLKSSVENGKIPKESIFAINPFETTAVVISFLSKNDFPFTFIEAPGVSQRLNISSTPTTLFIEKNEITSMKSGLSFIGIWRAEYFLD
jgi:thiol-disulfide isomerase/thioredoxin